MTEFWETAFAEKALMWGHEPTASALFARDYFARMGVKEVLIPGVGYGRNANPFLACGMSVTGIEISETAIDFARSEMGLKIDIYHGSVANMPFDTKQYDGIFCYGLIHLLDASGREKLIRDCFHQLAPGGHMIFSLLSRKASIFGQGTKLGDNWYERIPNVPMYFYDTEAMQLEFGAYGVIEYIETSALPEGNEPFPFINVVCKKTEQISGKP